MKRQESGCINNINIREDKQKMKGYICEKCVFFDELADEQPCCGCVDGCNFEENEEGEE